jgi:hypothetical protein
MKGPTENAIFPRGIPSMNTTSYRRAFKGILGTPSKLQTNERVNKSSSLKFIANSSYQNDFKMPKIENYLQKINPSRSLLADVPDHIKKST